MGSEVLQSQVHCVGDGAVGNAVYGRIVAEPGLEVWDGRVLRDEGCQVRAGFVEGEAV